MLQSSTVKSCRCTHVKIHKTAAYHIACVSRMLVEFIVSVSSRDRVCLCAKSPNFAKRTINCLKKLYNQNYNSLAIKCVLNRAKICAHLLSTEIAMLVLRSLIVVATPRALEI